MAIRDYRATTTAPAAPGAPQVSVATVSDTRGAERLGAAIEDLTRAREEIDLNDARLAMVEGLGSMNADLTEDQDFRSMRDRYGSRLDELQSSVMDGVGAPRAKRRLELEFARARVGAEANVYRRQNMLEGGHARATLASTLRSTANSIPVAGSEEEAETLYNTGVDAIASLEESGHLNAEEGEAFRQQLDRDVSTALVLDAINTDAAAAAVALDEPGAYGLDEIERQRHLATAKRTAETEARQAKTKLERSVDTARGVLVRGGVVAPDDLLRLQGEVAGTEYEDQLAGAVKASEQLGSFYQATPAERKGLIAETRAKGIDVDDASVDGAFLSTLEQIDAAATAAMKADPVAYAITAEMPGAGPLDLGDQDSVDARMALVVELSSQHGAKAQVFTKAEREHFEDLFAEGSVDDQLSLVVAMSEGFGMVAPGVFKELGGVDPVIRRAGALVSETGSDKVARTILAGRKAMEAGEELRAVPDDVLAIFEKTIDGAMSSQPGRREEVIEAAKAYYAAKAPGRVTGSNPKAQRELMTEAVQRVLGGDEVGGELYGGIQEVNGLRVKLPSTLTAGNITDMFDAAGEDIWAAGSLSGNGPHEGDMPVLPRDAVLQWVDGTTYRVGVQSRRGGVEWYQDPGVSNGFFYVDLYKMAEAHMRKQGAEGK